VGGKFGTAAGTKRPAEQAKGAPPGGRQQRRRVSLKAPVVMRGVTAFQKKHQVGEGTYGSVFMGADQVTGEIVALKRINTEEEENGFPITAIREVKILKALSHDNIVQLKEIVTSKDHGDIPKNVFMVMEYLDYDLTGVIETPEIKISQDHIKSWSNQLLKGVHYMHINRIIHRDLKASNLLINRRGELKIADFGLARSWNPEMRRLTNRVITLWYRPPELLLGCMKYSPKIDMWSVGCIIAEMFRRGGLLKGTNEAHQLDLIFKMMGHPTTADWPNIHKMCPLWKNYEPKEGEEGLPRRLREDLKSRLPTNAMNWMTSSAMEVIDNLLAHNPDKRWSAAQALTAEWFFDDPIVKPASKLNMKFSVDSAHEWEARKKHKEMMAQRQAALAVGGRNAGR
jgi:cyclin-dependent kinase 12/13